LNPAVTDSRYDPATQTIYAAYEMTQNGRPNQFIYDTLVYRGPRWVSTGVQYVRLRRSQNPISRLWLLKM